MMPSGWDVYYVVFLSAVLALAIPAGLGLVSILMSGRGKRPGPSSATPVPPVRDESALGRRMNTRFFLSANAALALIALGLVVIPCAGTLQAGETRAEVLRGLVAIVSIAGFAAIGLLYAARKGDLDWLRSYRSGERERK
jgi:hypothetical protein